MRGAFALAALSLATFSCVRAPPSPRGQEVIIRHKVQPGQTVYGIAKAYGLKPDALRAANGMSKSSALEAGQYLLIPGASESKSVPPPNVGPMAESAPAARDGKRRAAETRDDPSEPSALASRYSTPNSPPPKERLDWPLRGVLYGRFGKKGKELHDGIDLAAPEGTPVTTAAEGTVIFAGEQKGYGQIVIVEHDNGLITLYAHNRDVRVKSGQRVRKGQVVATVGQSGKTSGPHLHFEVRHDGMPVDPLNYLGSIPES